MTHVIHVLTNSFDEAYIVVNKSKHSKEFFVNRAYSDNKHFQKKNAPQANFIVQAAGDIGVECFDVPVELTTHKEILDYRESIIAQYEADGYFIVDEKFQNLMEQPADDNFAEVRKLADINKMLKVYSKEVCLKMRKVLTVGEFVNIARSIA